MPIQEIDATTHTQIIQSLSEKLKAYYVYPEVAEQICGGLKEHLEAGEYTDITDGEFLALALTTHIQEINQDKHLWVRWYPQPLPNHEGSLLQNQERLVEFRQQAKLNNYGIYNVERLPGNIGLIDMRYF
ncbi:MAG: hypothetical protein MUO62_13165 [Anaerolineales bacterium]|nr:hypothetical protein [Anaerolineales bacterium]